MDDLHRGLRLIDVLAAGTARTGDGHVEVFGLQDDFGFLGFGEYGHRGGGGVNAAGGLGGGHALDAVDAGLVAEEGGGAFAFDEQDRIADAAQVGVGEGHQFALPALLLGEAGVGAEELGGEEGGLFSARPGADFYKSITRIVRIHWDDGPDQLFAGHLDGRLQSGDFLGGHGADLGVGLAGKGAGLAELLFQGHQGIIGLDGLGREPEFGAEGGGPAVIGKGGGVGHQGFELGQATAEGGQVGAEGAGGHREGRLIGLGQKTSVRYSMECGRLPSASPTFIPFPTDMQPKEPALRGTHVLTCVWDFDKTLCPGYMQTPLFKAFGVDEEQFWKETNQLPALYARKGIRTPKDSVYLNHLLSYVKSGLMKGLTNARLRELGAEIELCPGLPQFFPALKEHVRELGRKHHVEVVLEHYVISTGLAEMIRGTTLAAHCDGIYGCEFLEHPLPPHFTKQDELSLDLPTEITQVAAMVDNTIKTRFLFEINKGSNKNADIDVNAVVRAEDRRVPFENMIYVADGPSDVPVFSLLRKNGGKAFAVYVPESEAEFAQNDALLQAGRVHGYGPCDYSAASFTPKWIRHALAGMVERLAQERTRALAARVTRPPRHLHADPSPPGAADAASQGTLFGE